MGPWPNIPFPSQPLLYVGCCMQAFTLDLRLFFFVSNIFFKWNLFTLGGPNIPFSSWPLFVCRLLYASIYPRASPFLFCLKRIFQMKFVCFGRGSTFHFPLDIFLYVGCCMQAFTLELNLFLLKIDFQIKFFCVGRVPDPTSLLLLDLFLYVGCCMQAFTLELHLFFLAKTDIYQNSFKEFGI